MFETIGWGMNYPNEDDGGWVDAMCWQLLVSLDLSRSFTEFPESTNFKTIWLFEEFHLIHDTSQGQQFRFFAFDFKAVGCRHGERDTGALRAQPELAGSKNDRKILVHLRGFQDPGNSNQREGILCQTWIIHSKILGRSPLPEGSFVENWSKIVSYIVWFPFFPSYSSNQKYQNPSLEKKQIHQFNPKNLSQGWVARGVFFCFVFKQWMPGDPEAWYTTSLIFKHHKGEKKPEKQKSIQMQWCPSLLHSIFNRFFKKKSYLWGDTMNSIWTPGQATGKILHVDQLTKTAGWKSIDPEWRCRKYFLSWKWGYIIEY